MEWTVYVIRCRSGELYTGCTTNLQRRIEEHNDGTGSKFTRGRGPVTVIYTEACAGRSEALKRELQIKSLSRREKLVLALQAHSATTE